MYPYVWKNEKLCHEKAARTANERCARRAKANDHGDG